LPFIDSGKFLQTSFTWRLCLQLVNRSFVARKEVFIFLESFVGFLAQLEILPEGFGAMEHDKARKHSRRDAGEHHRHKRHHRHSDDRERGDYAPNYSDSRTDARASYAAQSQADDVDSQASLELTLAMWESPGVRAATRELFFGSSSRSPLPLNLEEKFDDFVRLYLRRRATTKTRPPPTNADPPAAPPAMAGGRAPYSAAIDNSASSMSSSMSSSGVGSSSYFIDRQPSSKESLPNSRSSKLALPTGPFDRRFTVNCVVRTGTEGEAPRHTQPRNAAEVSSASKGARRFTVLFNPSKC